MKKTLSIIAFTFILFVITVFSASAVTEAPEKVTSTSTKNTITVNWTEVADADGYTLFYRAPEGTKWTKCVKSTNSTSHTFTNVSRGKTFVIAVQSYKLDSNNKFVYGEYATVETATKPAATKKIASAPNTSSIKLTWSAVTGATHYRVYQKSGNSWKHLGYVTKTAATIKNLNSGTKYTFAIRSYIKLNNKAVEGDYRTIETATKTVAPGNLQAKTTGNAIKLSWNKVSGADGYRIYYKNSYNAAWKIAVSSTTGTSKSWSGLSYDTIYYFAVQPYVRAASGVVWGSYSELMTKTDEYEYYEEESTTPTGNEVWIPTNGGTKYHSNSSCSNMTNPRQVTKDYAISMGYDACKKCYN